MSRFLIPKLPEALSRTWRETLTCGSATSSILPWQKSIGFRVEGWVLGLRFQGLGCKRALGSGLGGLRVLGSGTSVQGSGVRC